jgi:hypothetical protein
MAQKNIENSNSQPENFVFGKANYRIMLISIAVVILGFILMIG